MLIGFLFKGHPTLMTLDSSATMMDAIFSSPDEEEQARLLRLLQEFLVSEATKHSAIEKGMSFRVSTYYEKLDYHIVLKSLSKPTGSPGWVPRVLIWTS